MSYLVFARKYRPDSFQTVSGQEHVTTSLRNAIEQQRIGHAYLLSGPRGVGKTSIARIFAKCLNCQQGPTATPCLECPNCKEIASGVSLAVREIDGASHNSVDNVRELIESFRSLPPPGTKYKVYIIDEVHMLSLSAFNALLKSLEEPPPNTVFILATTEPQKIPETVLSRCQRFDFRALSSARMEERLSAIAKSEGFSVDPAALRLIARLAEGSMRDAQTLLDRVHAFSGGSISVESASAALGTVDRKILVELLAAIFDRDADLALSSVERAFQSGAETALFVREFIGILRDCLLASQLEKKQLLLQGMSEEEFAELQELSKKVDRADLLDLYQIALKAGDEALRSSFAKYSLEALIVRLSTREPVKDIAEILSRLRNMLQTRGRGADSLSQERSQHTPLRKSVPRVMKEAPASTQEKTGQYDLGEWERFVQYVLADCSPVLGEHLRRLGVKALAKGTLSLIGPRFHAQAVQTEDSLTKLKQALSSFFKADNWKLSFDVEEEHGEPTQSLLFELQKKQFEEKKAKRDQVLSHPQVQAIREAFPGTSVESIRMKRERGE